MFTKNVSRVLQDFVRTTQTVNMVDVATGSDVISRRPLGQKHLGTGSREMGRVLYERSPQ